MKKLVICLVVLFLFSCKKKELQEELQKADKGQCNCGVVKKTYIGIFSNQTSTWGIPIISIKNDCSGKVEDFQLYYFDRGAVYYGDPYYNQPDFYDWSNIQQGLDTSKFLYKEGDKYCFTKRGDITKVEDLIW